MNNVVAQPQAFQAMKTDIEVSMDDVVSAFVSQYENNLFARKKDLTHDIKLLENDLRDVKDAVRVDVNGREFTRYSLPFNMTIEVNSGTINWEEKRVTFIIWIKGPKTRNYRDSIDITKIKPIPAVYLKKYKKLNEELEELRAELSEVLVSLKSITRKERQVRGRIAMRKLEDSGYASLMQDEELIQLVQLDDD